MPSVGPVSATASLHSPSAPVGGTRSHVVRAGDTLTGIADAHGVSLPALVAANPAIKDPDVLRVGQEVRVPAAPPPGPPPPQVEDPLPGTVRSPDSRRGAAERLGGGVAREPLTAAAPAAPAWDQVRSGSALLQRGQEGPAVTELQDKLTARGFGVQATGVFGPTTEGVVKHFQQTHGLEADGVVGPLTVKALEAPAQTGRALQTPVINQHDSGSYPGGYCAVTALRMSLRLEGQHDPGADAVALGGSHPYQPGQGSDGSLLAARARELGLPNASFTTTGSLEDVKRQLARGHAVPIGGEGPFRGTAADGSVWEHSYRGSGHWMAVVGYDETSGKFQVNDPDRGKRFSVSAADMARFFTPDGPHSAWMITY